MNEMFQPQWNLYDIKPEDNEHDLFRSVIQEFNDIAGFPIMYFELDADKSDFDQLYGENTNLKYKEAKLTRMVYDPAEESRVLSTFGLTSDDTLQYIMIPKETFKRDVSDNEPKPGDVLKTLWNNRNYEIVNITSEQKIFKAKKHVWEIICKPFRFAEESISTQEIYDDTFNAPVWDDKLWADDSTLDSIEPSGSLKSISPSAIGTPTLNKDNFNDNVFIEKESEEIHDYKDKDTKIYGY